jgi:heptosyltransferase I
MLGQITELKSLCLLRLSAIGDVCHAVAMVQSIQRQYPTIKITWVIGKVEANLLHGLPGVEWVIFDKKAGLQGYLDLHSKLKDRHFDVLFHMQVALRASFVSTCISATHKIGFDRKRAKEGQWLFTNQKIAAQNNPHVLDGFLGFAQAIGVTDNIPSWDMPITAEALSWVGEQQCSNKPMAVICPSASKAERNWHSQGYAQIADQLSSRGFNLVLCGGPTDEEKLLAEKIANLAECDVTNLVGKTNLKQLLALLKQAYIVIAPDTGPTHMAVTVGTPVIGLYAHSNPARTGPYYFQHYVVSCYQQAIQKQYGKALAKLPWGLRAKGDALMRGITVEQVTQKINLLITDNYPEMM